jgi:hypothetical protein
MQAKPAGWAPEKAPLGDPAAEEVVSPMCKEADLSVAVLTQSAQCGLVPAAKNNHKVLRWSLQRPTGQHNPNLNQCRRACGLQP